MAVWRNHGMFMVVRVEKVSGSQTYWGSLTVPPMELPQRSPMYSYEVPEAPWNRTMVVLEP
ncbi:hypothetical protein [Streptomyces sp. NPDC013187]|uniref:hypothetical protein n=1 Tax=Streptomyces sp. NPDC013187 TaxID=3364865 RepID=UPI00368E722E